MGRLIIALVRLYQRFAPHSIRARCRFEPSCSEYMIGAVEKHGAIRGVRQGIGRLSRCHYPNGGIDLP
jgi:putative membrane protein insertion efficiency factor